MQVIIFSTNFYDFEHDKVEIGGLQTYVRDLSELLDSESHNVTIIQLNPKITDGDTRRHGNIVIKNHVPPKGNQQKVFDQIARQNHDALFILATDQLSINASRYNSIQVQHGIAFDIPGDMIPGFWGKTHGLQFMNKILRCIKNIRRFNQAQHTVCVDYNCYNWFRTLGTIRQGQQITVIPNYANEALTRDELDKKLSSINGVRKIVFARRFVDYRGTLMFADIIPDILAKYPDIEITLAGNGPLEAELHKRFDAIERIRFTSFDSSQSLAFHREFDVAIIPTIFSEGTSLSLCEAMAAGCLPICTHVGGMTNIILDGYNGLSVYPSAQELRLAIDKTISLSKDDFVNIVSNAHACATSTFSKHHWADCWKKVITKHS